MARVHYFLCRRFSGRMEVIMKRIISVILAVLALSMLASCRRVEENAGEEATVPPVETSNITADAQVTENDAGKGGVSDETTEYEQPEDILTEDTWADTEPDSSGADTDTPEPSEDTTVPITDTMTEAKAVTLARDFLGEKDPVTGNVFSFRFDSITTDGDYMVKVSWYLEEDERWAPCGYILVTPEGEVSKFNW